jgi:hypothetical protein
MQHGSSMSACFLSSTSPPCRSLQVCDVFATVNFQSHLLGMLVFLATWSSTVACICALQATNHATQTPLTSAS